MTGIYLLNFLAKESAAIFHKRAYPAVFAFPYKIGLASAPAHGNLLLGCQRVSQQRFASETDLPGNGDPVVIDLMT